MPTIKEVLAIQKQKQKAIASILNILEEDGYTHIEPQLVESYPTFMSNEPFVDARKLVKFTLPDGNMYTLRPDITSSILNQYVQLLKEDDVLKLSYVASYYRQNKESLVVKPQIGFECFGNVSLDDHIQLIKKILSKTNKKMTIVMNMPSLIESLIKDASSKDDIRVALKGYLRLKSALGIQQLHIETRLKETLLKTIDQVYEMNTLPEFAKQAFENTFTRDVLEDLSYFIDLSLVPQYDYYSGIYLEGYMEGYAKPVLYGGSYDKRTTSYGNFTQAFGISLDLDMIVSEFI